MAGDDIAFGVSGLLPLPTTAPRQPQRRKPSSATVTQLP
jgi:hypothetical protein